MPIRSILTKTLRRIQFLRRLLNLPAEALFTPGRDACEVELVLEGPHHEPILVLDRGYIWGNQGTVLNADRQVVDGYSREFERSGSALSIFQQYRIKPAAVIDADAAVVTAAGSDVYYHWMIDVYPRLYSLVKSGLAERVDHICATLFGKPYQEETMARLGIDQQKLINTRLFDTHIRFRRLFVPQYSAPVNMASEFAIEALRTTFLKGEHHTGARKIFLPRRGHRKLINTDELERKLIDHGFEVVHPEHHTIAVQARLFAESSVVAGIHGSALTNLVFCRPGTRVIEIIPPKWKNRCFEDIASKVGLHYSAVVGKGMATGIATSKSEDFYLENADIQRIMSMINNA